MTHFLISLSRCVIWMPLTASFWLGTDPQVMVDLNGADALRLYLINSPVVRAEPLRFAKDGVREVVKQVFLPWFNAYRFFVENAKRYESSMC
jgi:isoleucyl-tRNA synthetase